MKKNFRTVSALCLLVSLSRFSAACLFKQQQQGCGYGSSRRIVEVQLVACLGGITLQNNTHYPQLGEPESRVGVKLLYETHGISGHWQRIKLTIASLITSWHCGTGLPRPATTVGNRFLSIGTLHRGFPLVFLMI